MNIKEKSGNLTMAEMYRLTKSPDIAKMSSARDQELELANWIAYEDINATTGETSLIVSVCTVQGETYASNSKTFAKDFLDIVDMCREAGEALPHTIKVLSKHGKSGRDYIQCVYIN